MSRRGDGDGARAPVEAAERRLQVSFYARGKASMGQYLREAARYRDLRKTPYGLRPIVVFTILGAVLAIDGSVFTLATPEIIADLDIDILPLIGVFSIISLFLIFITLGLSWLADRVRRTPFVAIGTILTGIFSTLTAGARGLWDFGLWRAGDAVSGQVLDAPVGSLMADYYPPEQRGKAFAARGVTFNAIRIVAPLIVAGLVSASSLTWRLPYLITGPLLIVLGIWALRALRDPIRGFMERRAVGLSEEDAAVPEEPVSFGEAWRAIWSIRTVRRLFISDIFAGPAVYIYGVFFNIFLFEHYGLSIFERALILGSVVGVFAFPFGLAAGGIVDVLMRRRPQRVLVFSGMLSVAGSLSVLGVALGPPLAALVAIVCVFAGAQALLGPSRGVLFAQIVPANMRTLGLNMSLLAAIPGTIGRFYIVSFAFSNWGTQGALFSAFPLLFISSLIDLSAAGLFERDFRAAVSSQSASLEWKRAKAAKRAKMLVCRDVDVEYNGVQVLFGVDFDVEEGDLVALLGTNGAGKSTLLNAISGVHEASNGAVVFDGRDITHMPPNESAARGVILMPGGRGIFPNLTVYENLLLGNWLNDEEEGRKRLDEVFGVFPVLRQRSNERAQLLSGGEQQLLSLAQAFLTKPRLLLIDELSLGLAPAVVRNLIDIVKRIHEQGTTVVIVEQSVNVALTVADRAIFMEKGEVKFVGRTEDLLRRPDILRAVYVKGAGALTAAGPASAARGSGARRRHDLEGARAVLKVDKVSKAFGGIVAAKDVSFDVREGEILGLIGPNGAGKTTVFDMVSGYLAPDTGRLVYDGADITDMSPEERARLGLVRRFQDARLFPSLSVYENILVALERYMEVRSITLTALQVPQARAAERRVRRRADRLVEMLQLEAYRDKFVKELSTGLRRITDVACVLATEPKLLLLDEPSTGIAQAEAENLAPLIRRIAFETGCTMLVIEHDMPLISSIADELIAMDQGAVIMRGRPDEVLGDERVITSYLGSDEDVVQRSDTRRVTTKTGKRR